jgi:hypothetical protein
MIAEFSRHSVVYFEKDETMCRCCKTGESAIPFGKKLLEFARADGSSPNFQ